MVEPSEEPGVVLLPEPCTKDLLAKILSSDHPERVFMNFEPRVRVLLLMKLRYEVLQLRENDVKWQQITRINPCIDTRIHLIPGRTSSFTTSDFPIIDHWSYENEFTCSDEERKLAEPRFIHWSTNQLYSDSRGSDLKVCLHSNFFCAQCHHQGSETPSEPGSRVSFINRISSYLLHYRIVVTYGMIPPIAIPNPSSYWKIDLQHVDALSVAFNGTEEASEDALGVLDYLIGEYCLHTYGGVIAGTVP
jgi:hypothetical protein